MSGIIKDNVGRSSGLIKSAAAPAGTVLVGSAYCSSSSSAGNYSTWTSRVTGGVGGSYGEWGGALPSSSLAVTWGSNPAITFPATGVYQIWAHFRTNTDVTNMLVSVDDGSYGASNGFMYVRASNQSGHTDNYRHFGVNFGYTVDDTSNDVLRFYTNQILKTGQSEGSSIIVAKFE